MKLKAKKNKGFVAKKNAKKKPFNGLQNWFNENICILTYSFRKTG